MTKRSSLRQLDEADPKASHRLHGKRDTWGMRTLGAGCAIGNRPQLRLLCTAVTREAYFAPERVREYTTRPTPMVS